MKTIDHFTREQIIAALKALGLDPEGVQSVYMDLNSVVITKKMMVIATETVEISQ